MTAASSTDDGRRVAARALVPFVNPSLSRGLADRAVAVLAAQGNRYRAESLPILRRRIRSKKSLSREAADLVQVGEHCRLIQVIGKSPNGRQVTIGQFVPDRVQRFGDHSVAAIRFDLWQYVLSTRGMSPGPDWGRALVANEHAVERLFLRLNTLDLGLVSTELHDAMLLALPLAAVGRLLGLQQLALPTSSGAFLCDLPSGRDYMIAKTWVGNGGLGARWEPVVSRLRSAVVGAGGETSLAECVAIGTTAALSDSESPLSANLTNALATFTWLRTPYTERDDPVGEMWKQARLAAERAEVQA